jgi:hypothetical protein
MTEEQILLLESAWDLEGFLGCLRDGEFDNDLYHEFILLLRSISFDEDALIPKKVITLLWYIPLFMDWQLERIQNVISSKDYNLKKTSIENELERILGVP